MFKKLLSSISKQKDEATTLPLPPLELRRLVGPTDVRDFDNPDGRLIWGDMAYGPLGAGEAYQHVFDFGCGCGREARQLLQQRQPLLRYVGVDISPTMIQWCQQNLDRPGFKFFHHDVWSPNPCYGSTESPNKVLPLRQYGTDFTLINALSVFTHLLEPQARFYLQELRSMLAENGLFRVSWFFFNRDWFPILNPDQHCLYVNDADPTQAVYYDWGFFVSMIQELGLKLVDVSWAEISGHQSMVLLARGDAFEDRSATVAPSGRVLGFGSSAPPLSAQD
jgi:SAM-dependent methyltransferase